MTQPAHAGSLEEEVRLLAVEVGRLSSRFEALAVPLRTEHPVSLTASLIGQVGRDASERHLLRRPAVPLPDPRLIRRIIRQRRARQRYFDAELFADPAWDILLDLACARAEHRRVSVTSLCIAAAVPATTALRWIAQMTAMKILIREPDPRDRRRAFVALSDKAADAIARYFHELGDDAVKAI